MFKQLGYRMLICFFAVCCILMMSSNTAFADSVKEQTRLYDVKTAALASSPIPATPPAPVATEVIYTTVCDGNTCRRVAVTVPKYNNVQDAISAIKNNVSTVTPLKCDDCVNCTNCGCQASTSAKTTMVKDNGTLQISTGERTKWVPFAKIKAAIGKVRGSRGGCSSCGG